MLKLLLLWPCRYTQPSEDKIKCYNINWYEYNFVYLCKQTETHPTSNLLTCIQNSNVLQTLKNSPLQVVDIPLFFDVKEPFIARNIGLISSVSNIKIQFNFILYLICCFNSLPAASCFQPQCLQSGTSASITNKYWSTIILRQLWLQLGAQLSNNFSAVKLVYCRYGESNYMLGTNTLLSQFNRKVNI